MGIVKEVKRTMNREELIRRAEDILRAVQRITSFGYTTEEATEIVRIAVEEGTKEGTKEGREGGTKCQKNTTDGN